MALHPVRRFASSVAGASHSTAAKSATVISQSAPAISKERALAAVRWPLRVAPRFLPVGAQVWALAHPRFARVAEAGALVAVSGLLCAFGIGAAATALPLCLGDIDEITASDVHLAVDANEWRALEDLRYDAAALRTRALAGDFTALAVLLNTPLPSVRAIALWLDAEWKEDPAQTAVVINALQEDATKKTPVPFFDSFVPAKHSAKWLEYFAWALRDFSHGAETRNSSTTPNAAALSVEERLARVQCIVPALLNMALHSKATVDKLRLVQLLGFVLRKGVVSSGPYVDPAPLTLDAQGLAQVREWLPALHMLAHGDETELAGAAPHSWLTSCVPVWLAEVVTDNEALRAEVAALFGVAPDMIGNRKQIEAAEEARDAQRYDELRKRTAPESTATALLNSDRRPIAQGMWSTLLEADDCHATAEFHFLGNDFDPKIGVWPQGQIVGSPVRYKIAGPHTTQYVASVLDALVIRGDEPVPALQRLAEFLLAAYFHAPTLRPAIRNIAAQIEPALWANSADVAAGETDPMLHADIVRALRDESINTQYFLRAQQFGGLIAALPEDFSSESDATSSRPRRRSGFRRAWATIRRGFWRVFGAPRV